MRRDMLVRWACAVLVVGMTGAACAGEQAPALDGEQLNMSFTTTEAGGPYRPRNVVAVWIQTEAGAFVKTIGRWADRRRSELVEWWGASGGGDNDAVSGATRPNHAGTLTVTWDMTNRSGAVVDDGTYTVILTLTDSDGAPNTNRAQFTFAKDGSADSRPAASRGGFNDVTLEYTGRAQPADPSVLRLR